MVKRPSSCLLVDEGDVLAKNEEDEEHDPEHEGENDGGRGPSLWDVTLEKLDRQSIKNEAEAQEAGEQSHGSGDADQLFGIGDEGIESKEDPVPHLFIASATAAVDLLIFYAIV